MKKKTLTGIKKLQNLLKKKKPVVVWEKSSPEIKWHDQKGKTHLLDVLEKNIKKYRLGIKVPASDISILQLERIFAQQVNMVKTIKRIHVLEEETEIHVPIPGGVSERMLNNIELNLKNLPKRIRKDVVDWEK